MTGAFAEALSASLATDDASPASETAASEPVTEETPSAPEASPQAESVQTETADTTTAASTTQPDSETPATEQSVSTTATTSDQPATESEQAQDEASATPEAPGEPPKWRWQDILSNARDTTAQETEDRVRQEYAWAKDLMETPENERQNLVAWYRSLNTDPLAALSSLSEAVQSDPSLRERLEQHRAQAAPAVAEPEPEPDLQNSDGTLVYSAPQLKSWQQWNQKQLLADMEQRLAPLQRAATQAESVRLETSALNEANAAINSFREDADFMKHTADIKTLIEQDARLAALADRDPKAALDVAWTRVYREKVLPNKLKQTEAEVLTKLQQKAQAGSVNPSAPNAATPKKFSQSEAGFAQALAHFNATRG